MRRLAISSGRICTYFVNLCTISAIILIYGYSIIVFIKFLNPSDLPISYIPGPLASRQDITQNLVWHVLVTIGRSVISYSIALAAYAVLASIGPALTRPLRIFAFLYQAVPPLVMFPLILLSFGVNERSFVAASSVFCLMGFIVSAPQGRKADGWRRLQFAKGIGVGHVRLIVSLRVPEAYHALRPGFLVVWLALVGVGVVVEYLGSSSGFGRVLSVLVSYSDLKSVLVGSAICGACAALPIVVLSSRSIREPADWAEVRSSIP